jgi:hypothetical protein
VLVAEALVGASLKVAGVGAEGLAYFGPTVQP